jgi:low affinity Fe/Cu permease
VSESADESQASLHPPGSWLLHVVDRFASRPKLALFVVIGDVVWLIFSVVIGFPLRLETIFQTVVAGVTLAMVFVIQHTQARVEAVTQRKLDEILRALPQADNSMITLEEAPDSELAAAADTHRQVRRASSR